MFHRLKSYWKRHLERSKSWIKFQGTTLTLTDMLDEFQRRFASGLLIGMSNRSAPEGLGVDPLRFGVYAHNARLSLTKAIENAFPVTRQLVGADFFTAMAEQFVATHPPTEGWLSAYGVGFPHFVSHY